MEMAMAHDGHYNSDSPVFYKNYKLPKTKVRPVFLLCSDVLDTLISTYRHPYINGIDTPINTYITFHHCNLCPTSVYFPCLSELIYTTTTPQYSI